MASDTRKVSVSKYDSGETGREVSYQTSKPDKMSKRRFGKVMRRMGRKHGQESVITKDKDKLQSTILRRVVKQSLTLSVRLKQVSIPKVTVKLLALKSEVVNFLRKLTNHLIIMGRRKTQV